MRYICILLALALAAPAWAKTATTVGGDGTQLTPQQVQFMRWWRAQNTKVVNPAARPIETTSHTGTKPLTITVSTANRAAVKPATTTIKVQQPITPAPADRVQAIVQTSTTSLGALKAVLVGTPPRTSTTLQSQGDTARVTTEPRRQSPRGWIDRGNPDRPSKDRPVPRTSTGGSSGKLVIAQPRLTGGEPPPPDTLTRLRYQLELSQME